MKHKDRELSLEELEIVRGGFDYSGFYKYRAEILNTHQIRSKSLDMTIYMHDYQGISKSKIKSF